MNPEHSESGYEANEHWAKLPPGWSWTEVAGVANDSQDCVFVFNRGEHPVIVFDRDGNFLRSWGEGVFARPQCPKQMSRRSEFPDGVIKVICAIDSVIGADGDAVGTGNGMILRFDPSTRKISTFTANSGKSNGLAFLADGSLVSCDGADGGGRCVLQGEHHHG